MTLVRPKKTSCIKPNTHSVSLLVAKLHRNRTQSYLMSENHVVIFAKLMANSHLSMNSLSIVKSFF